MATYYISLAGTDGGGHTGSIGDPWRTFGFGLTRLALGDTLYARAGTYNEAITDPAMASGSPTIPITVKAYPGETVWLKPPTPVGQANSIQFQNVEHYLVFDGINLDYTNGTLANPLNGINITSSASNGCNCDHLTFKNMEILAPRYTNGSLTVGFTAVVCTALASDAIGYNQFINLKIHGGGGANFTYGFYIQSGNNTFTLCEIYDMGFQGGQFYTTLGPTLPVDNVFTKNRVHDIADGFDTRRFGVTLAGNNNLIADNLIWHINVGAGSVPYDTEQQDIQVFEGDGNRIYNNTLAYGVSDALGVGSVNGTTMINNIAWGHSGGGSNTWIDYSSSGTVSTTNSWDLFPGTDPQFVNGTGSPPDFHLLVSSPAINAGTTLSDVPDDFDGLPRPQQTAYCLGAYEYPASVANVFVNSRGIILGGGIV